MAEKEISRLRLSGSNLDGGEEGMKVEFIETLPSQKCARCLYFKLYLILISNPGPGHKIYTTKCTWTLSFPRLRPLGQLPSQQVTPTSSRAPLPTSYTYRQVRQ